MSTTVPLEEAQARLAELIEHLAPGDEIVITQNDQPVAKLVSSRSPTIERREALVSAGSFLACEEDRPTPVEMSYREPLPLLDHEALVPPVGSSE
jgi:prevent-host-death family protein